MQNISLRFSPLAQKTLCHTTQSLLLEMETSKQKIDMCATHFHKDMQDLKQHVGGRNSVSKEVCMHAAMFVYMLDV